MLTPDEKDIIDYLKGWPVTYVSGREIARRVGGRARYEEDRGWALPVLMELCNKGLVCTDGLGAYKLVTKDETKKKFIRPISPQILQILRSSGKSFEGVAFDLEEDEELEEEAPEEE